MTCRLRLEGFAGERAAGYAGRMRGLSLGLSLGVSAVCALSGCSADKAPDHGVIRNNNAGAPSTPSGGQAGSAPVFVGSGGAAVMIKPDEMKDAGPPDAPVEASVCDDLSIQTYEAVPTVQVLVDTSGSMFQPREQLWDPLYKALTDPTNGVIAMLQDKVRFGFTSYTATSSATCPTLINTDPKLKNFDTIKTAYTDVGTKAALNPNGDTPTGASIAAVTKNLLAFMPDPPGPKFILLVTDGDPDTCTVNNPNCGQDESIKAIQDAYAAGIATFVIGIGDIATKLDPTMRTGTQHLQDIANAGSGKPVAPNTTNYGYSACIVAKGYTAAYAATVAEGGTAPYYIVTAKDGTMAQKQIADAILSSLSQARSCSFNMDAKVTGDASLGMLTFNGNQLPFGDQQNGWSLGTDLTSITLNGAACDAWKKSGGKVDVNFPCKLVPVVHVDPPVPK